MKRQFLVTANISGNINGAELIRECLSDTYSYIGAEVTELEPDHAEEFNTLMTTLEMEQEAASAEPIV